MTVMGQKLVPALLVAGLAATASAQQKCDIDENKPSQVAVSVLDIQVAQNSAKPEDAAAKLKDAVKKLHEGDMKVNPVGRNYELGRVYVLFTTQPSVTSGMTTRGALGYVDNPAAPFDLYAGIDSAFTVVETANPECVSETAQWRQQKPWVDLVNKALEAANADKMDSAVALANRSLLLSKNAGYAYYVLAIDAQKKSKFMEALAQFKAGVAASKDSSQADFRRQLLQAAGGLASDAAEQSTGADKATYLNEAKTAYTALAADPGTKYADVARAGQARLAAISGDTNAIKASYADALANPSAFNYAQLMGAAVSAAKANQNKDAIKLFEAARTANPYHRDALYNLARLYMLDSSYAQGIPVARQLVAVDPSNPDNYQLIAIAYAAQQKVLAMKQKAADSTARALGARANSAKATAAQKKAAIDSVPRVQKLIAVYNDSSKVMLDSALKYNSLITSIPAKVLFNEFSPSEGKVTLGGQVTNQTDAARSFTLKIDFLDKGGSVVSSQSVDVPAVDAHRAKPFKVEGTGAGIVAFRYAPIT
ncbi:MAG TPA: hypothetical protein VGM82_15730 [Gemmatimonadaceae bacterium]|jgi:hypothetical protein